MKPEDQSKVNQESNIQVYSNIQPIWQFAVLNFISLGIYQFYWFYKKWKFVKDYKKSKISPACRTLFIPWSLHSLFGYIFDLATNRGYKIKYVPCMLTIAYIALEAMIKLPAPYWGTAAFSFIPLIPAVEASNYFWDKEQPSARVRPHFSRGEVIFLIICGVIFIVPRIGILPSK